MFRLIKLGVYALIGYGLYEFFRGLSGEGSSQRQPQKQSYGQRSGRQSGQTLTGRGAGMTQQTAGSDGGHASHVVGRGVVSR